MNVINLDTGENEERPELIYPEPVRPPLRQTYIPTGPALHGIPDVAGVHEHLSFAPSLTPPTMVEFVQVPRTPVQAVAGAILVTLLALGLVAWVIWLVAV